MQVSGKIKDKDKEVLPVPGTKVSSVGLWRPATFIYLH